jgi:drug/metabolite transporter (DMT)-like permease
MWGLGQVGIRAAGADITPLMHAGIRSAGASVVLLIWIFWKKPQVLENDGTLGLGMIIGALFGLEFILLFQGLMLTTASRGTLMLYMSSFFVAIGAHFFVANDKLNARKIIGLVCAFVGVLIVMLAKPSPTTRLPSPENLLLGDMLCLLAAIAWAATTLVVKATRLKNALPEKNLIYQIGFSSIILLIASAVAQEKGVIKYTPLLAGVLAYGIFLVASVSYLAWFWLVSRYNATTLHAFTFLTPLFAMIFGAVLLDEPLGASLVIAAALIAAGIVLVNKA